ncbi:hypothetical protein ACFWPU_07425 [Streptomyces sp. NPDC058471]|uniref:hypothetical protein n=1 Tax=Streptomyces sp. NPDC058471 TaxID=3346516 RepID=UPI00365612CF
MNAETFNARYPVGTPVVAYPCGRPEDLPSDPHLLTRTRSKAAVLGGHTDVVWVDGHGACIALSHIDVVTEAEFQAAQPITDTATTVRDLETVEPSRCTCLTPQYDYTHKSPSCPYFERPTETQLSKEREAYIREFANRERMVPSTHVSELLWEVARLRDACEQHHTAAEAAETKLRKIEHGCETPESHLYGCPCEQDGGAR